MARPLNILLIGAVGDAVIEKIEAVDSRIRVADARGKFEVEYAETWPAESVRRYVSKALVAANTSTRAERDALLAEAEVICIRFPFPLDLRARTPRLKWLHQTPAGASNLRMCDIWGSDVVVTTSRGLNNSLPIAEYVLSLIFLFAKALPQAFHDQNKQEFKRRAYRPILVQGKNRRHYRLGWYWEVCCASRQSRGDAGRGNPALSSHLAESDAGTSTNSCRPQHSLFCLSRAISLW